jgi:predicted methyltransferase
MFYIKSQCFIGFNNCDNILDMNKIYSNESAETRGTNLERVYAELLGGKIVGGFDDGGLDIVLEDNPKVSIVQIKSSQAGAKDFLRESLKRMEFVPIIVGDPGKYKKEEIIKSLSENGAWAGFDEEDREKFIASVKQIRDYILDNGGNYKTI